MSFECRARYEWASICNISPGNFSVFFLLVLFLSFSFAFFLRIRFHVGGWLLFFSLYFRSGNEQLQLQNMRIYSYERAHAYTWFNHSIILKSFEFFRLIFSYPYICFFGNWTKIKCTNDEPTTGNGPCFVFASHFYAQYLITLSLVREFVHSFLIALTFTAIFFRFILYNLLIGLLHPYALTYPIRFAVDFPNFSIRALMRKCYIFVWIFFRLPFSISLISTYAIFTQIPMRESSKRKTKPWQF